MMDFLVDNMIKLENAMKQPLIKVKRKLNEKEDSEYKTPDSQQDISKKGVDKQASTLVILSSLGAKSKVTFSISLSSPVPTRWW